jgi:hypothetical protein
LSKINENEKNGIDKLIFGMKQKDVTAIYGKPDRNYKSKMIILFMLTTN